ncbi:dCMP deaminase family protein [Candidatus Pacearchaeota archaeon]|nr:dCMP deaminase family protein [Candidatus Pacearchaeota archaeon]
MEKMRPTKDEYFLQIALDTSKRSTCKRRHFGAVIVKEDSQISSGYNGSARGAPNCLTEECLKDKYGMQPGMAYEHCRAGPLHAEVNAIINASRHAGGTIDSTIYIAGEYLDERISDAHPCKSCQKAIINAGIEKVVIRTEKGIETFLAEDWTKEAFETEDKDIKGFY